MARANEEVAALLREYAELISITGGDPFRARNYEKAASSVAGHSSDVTVLEAAALRKISGVGKSIADKIIKSGRAAVSRRWRSSGRRSRPGCGS